MSPWYANLPEAKHFSLFPPAGQLLAWTADKERTNAHLREIFPDLTFAITDIALDASPVVIPILGEAGEGGRGMYAAPPPDSRLREIERGLASLDLAGVA